MRLIDADKFILALMDASLSSVDEDTILDLVDSVPTVDAEPVILCKDCKYFLPPTKNDFTACRYDKCGGMLAPGPNDFCSYGERKDGGGEDG